MPAIQTELRVQVEGSRIPLLVRQTTLQVDSCEQFSLTVGGVPSAAPAKSPVGDKLPKKPAARLMKATYHPSLSNVKFAAIYDGGQASGIKVRVGSGGLLPLTQPIVYTERAASALGTRPSITLENASAAPRTALMIVGSDLPKNAHKDQLVIASGAKKKAKTNAGRKKGHKASKGGAKKTKKKRK